MFRRPLPSKMTIEQLAERERYFRAMALTASSEATNWYGLVAPAKTPKDIIERVNRDFVKALNAADVRDQLLSHGKEPTPTTPDEFGRFMKHELETWGKVVKEAGIQAE